MIPVTVSRALTKAALGFAVFLVLSSDAFSTTASVTATSQATLEVTSAGSPVTTVSPGTAVTLAATVVSSGKPVTPGTVTFCDLSAAKTCSGRAVLGTAQLTAAGNASIVLRLGPGSHSLDAVFAGTKTYAGSESATSELTVSGTLTRGTTISLSNSATPAITGLQPGAVAVGDFNNDGNLDMAVANATDLNQPVVDTTKDVVAVFLGKGDGTFQAGVSYHVGAVPVGLLAADLNNDGKLDLVTANLLDGTLSMLLGNGDGTFQAQQVLQLGFAPGAGASPTAITVGDMNGDGNLDLVVGIDGIGQSYVSILLGTGDGAFLTAKSSSIGLDGFPQPPSSLVAGDFNGDGKPDVAVANWGYENTGSLAIMLGNGDGTLQSASFPEQFTLIAPASSIAAEDLNGDGKLDLALTYGASGYTSPSYSAYFIFLGNGDGTFQDSIGSTLGDQSLLSPPVSPTSIQIADFNGDGVADLAMNGSGGPMILLGNGNGTFQAPVTFPFQESALAVGDFNGDGIPDLAGPAVLLNSVPGGMPPSFAISASPASLTLTQGSEGAVTVTVTPQYGFTGAVSFACSGLPAGAACTFNPMSVALSAAAVTTTLTIAAPGLAAKLPGRPVPLFPKLIPALVLGILLPRRWRRRLAVLLAIGLAGLSFLSACGGSGSHHPAPSTVSVTATYGSIHQTATIALTVN